jgi:hypothetical protein
MWGTKARVAAALAAETEARPGVSTRHRPPASSGLATNTSTAVTSFSLLGLCSSET